MVVIYEVASQMTQIVYLIQANCTGLLVNTASMIWEIGKQIYFRENKQVPFSENKVLYEFYA